MNSEISFPSYSIASNLFEELFIHEAYYFDTLEKFPIIIDCGSNIGLSLVFFKAIYPDSKIMGFEPDQSAYSFCQRNIRSLNDIEVHNIAIGNNEGSVVLYKNDSNSLTSSLVRTKNHTEEQEVVSRRLSDFIKSHIDFLKIDIEGSEIKVIDDLIEHGKLPMIRKMTIEYHEEITRTPVSEFVNKLRLNGFDCLIKKDRLHARSSEVLIICRNILKQ